MWKKTTAASESKKKKQKRRTTRGDKNNARVLGDGRCGRRKRREKKEGIPVTNGGCSRSNESPRWNSTRNKERVRGREHLGGSGLLMLEKRVETDSR